MTDVTQLLERIGHGDKSASDDLLPILYDELRKLASTKLAREKQSPSLQPTVLVHDAYLRLVGEPSAEWDGSRHFFAAAAEAMRRILIEHARRKQTEKHGGNVDWVPLSVVEPSIDPDPIDLLALDEAMNSLATKWPDRAELVKLRYFAGMTIAEASKAMGISHATAERHWRFARAFLYAQLNSGSDLG